MATRQERVLRSRRGDPEVSAALADRLEQEGIADVEIDVKGDS